MKNIKTLKNHIESSRMIADPLLIRLGDCSIHIHSNDAQLLQKLTFYFQHCHVIDEAQTSADIVIKVIQSEVFDPGLPFKDWPREAGKTGRKDAYLDFDQVRLITKVKTGMLFWVEQDNYVAIGPAIKHDNQIINFINAVYMSRLQNRGWLICHAAGLTLEGSDGIAIAGLSGGGKSTLMLRLMNLPDTKFVSNDRLFVKSTDQQPVMMTGIAKLPRINPGTLVNEPRLHHLLDQQQLQSYQSLSRDQLWDIEEKYDVWIDDCYGPQRFNYEAPLKHFIILNWQRDSDNETALTPVQIAQRQDLLAALMKSPGPFYQYQQGHFFQHRERMDAKDYLQQLQQVQFYEASGRIDFDVMQQLISAILTSN